MNNSKYRGMSILELLIYVAILAGLMVVVSDAFISLSKGRGQSEARSEVNATIRFAIEKIRQDVKGASALTEPTLGNSSAALNLTMGVSSVLYDVLNGQLRRNAVPITGPGIFVDMPTFTRTENYNATFAATTTAVQIAMTMRYNASNTDWTYSDSIHTTITLR